MKDKKYVNLFNQLTDNNLLMSQRAEDLNENSLSSQQSQLDLNASCLSAAGKENRKSSKNKANKKIVILGMLTSSIRRLLLS